MIGPNIFYLDRDYFIEMETLRKKFKKNPIKLNYRRVKYKTSKSFNGINGRPSMIVDNDITVTYINRGPIGIIFQSGCVIICNYLSKKLLPRDITMRGTFPNTIFTRYKWGIYLSFVSFEDAKRHNEYEKYWFYEYK